VPGPCRIVASYRLAPAGVGVTSTGSVLPMSKRTQKKKLNARKKKANHGRKPNMGRNS
jgi:hypothetical protein